MGRPRSEVRDQAFQIWLKSKGQIKLVDLAAKLGVADSKVRKWKAVDKWEVKLKGALQKEKGSVPKRPGAPKGSRNALGNRGGKGGPPGNDKAVTHGFFRKIFPDDPETMAIIEEIGIKSPLDILWENIVIQYTAIVRAQRIMFVKDQDDLTKVLKRVKNGEKISEREWELQHAWDKHANFLEAQSRAIKTLEGLIARYEELLPGALKNEEQRLRVEKLKAEVVKLTGGEDLDEDDGFIGALEGKAEEVWSDED
ncbi:MAG: phage terminase small subunit [Bacillota bacterium]